MFSEQYMQRSWVEVNLEQLIVNLKSYKKYMQNDSEIMAVIKADAYGHGDIPIAQKLYENGIKLFAVSNISEAITLRKAGIKGEILIFGYTPIEHADGLVEYDITQALLNEEYAEMLSKTISSSNIKAQFAIDTGMNRIGLNSDELKKSERIIRKYNKVFKINGIFTHLCVADGDNSESIEFTNSQIEKFEKISRAISDLELPFCHCLNSAGGLFHRCKYEDINKIVRLGIILYGLKPDYTNILPEEIKPILSWKSVVSMVKTVHKNETVGYGRSYIAPSDMIIATIPTGYADGYNRLLSNKGYVLINGKKASIVGRVCMDQMMVDVSDIDNVNIGDIVVLLGTSENVIYTADDMAKSINSIGYEVVCDISKRVPRIYFNNGRINLINNKNDDSYVIVQKAL